jgi:coenzyme F420 hydrogenase subunit delta
MYREIETRELLVLGCGNVLFGDDGFGPAVVERLHELGALPEHAHAEDVGTSVRDILFNVALLPDRPKRVVVLDAVQVEGREPGEVFELELGAMPSNKLPDFSYHQAPTTNMLLELREVGVDVRVVAAQAAHVPDHLQEGLSPPIRAAIEVAAERVLQLCLEPRGRASTARDHLEPCPGGGAHDTPRGSQWPNTRS